VREFFRNPVEKLHHLLFRKVIHHSLGDYEHWAVPGNLVDPVWVGDGKSEQLVIVGVKDIFLCIGTMKEGPSPLTAEDMTIINEVTWLIW
jgi:hypothetical protein